MSRQAKRASLLVIIIIIKVENKTEERIICDNWALGVFDVQTAYLSGCVKVIDVKKRYTSSPSNSRRNFSRVFYVRNSRGVSVRVQNCFSPHSLLSPMGD